MATATPLLQVEEARSFTNVFKFFNEHVSPGDRILNVRKFIQENIRLRTKSSSGEERLEKNDAFGTLCFQGFGQDTSTEAPYVKVSVIDSESNEAYTKEVAEKVWELMLHKNYWGLSTPKLIISVVGGAKNFHMKKKLLNNFKSGLVKAAMSAEAWIITGGTKTGVREIVGDAVREYRLENSFSKPPVAIGISSWGTLKNRKTLRNEHNNGSFPCYYNIHDFDEHEEKLVYLDPNHTFFVLVDNGLQGEEAFRGEIGFRAAFEQFTNGGSRSIPVVLLLLEGGLDTLQRACKAIEQGTPVVVLDGSGRAADLIAFAYDLLQEADDNIDVELKNKARELLGTRDSEYVEGCVACVNIILQDEHLITIIGEDENTSENMNQAILSAIIKARRSNKQSTADIMKQQLDLALSWNCYNVARSEIFSLDNMTTWTGLKEEFTSNLKKAMHRVLIEDKDAEFVNLFLDSGLNLKEFLTIKELYLLYDEMINLSSPPPIVCVLNNSIRNIKRICCSKKLIKLTDLLEVIGQIINNLTHDQRDNVYSGPEFVVGNEDAGDKDKLTKDDKKKDYTERELFLWSLLFNRRELAEIFWKLGQDHISSALTASTLLKALRIEADEAGELDLAQDLDRNSKYFEQLAIGVLNACYQKDKTESHNLLIRELDQWGGKTVFVLADAGQQMDFMEHTCCQTKLNQIWRGKMAPYTPRWQINISLPLPIIALLLIKFPHNHSHKGDNRESPEEESQQLSEQDSEQPSDQPSNGMKLIGKQNETKRKQNGGKPNNEEEKKKKPQEYFSDMFENTQHYLTAPVVKFCYHTISYIIFLGLFSFFMLTNLEPYDPSIPGFYPSIAEYIIWGWVLTLWIEEARQLYTAESRTLSKKCQAYFSSSWNRFDQVVNGLFIISVILRWTLPSDQFVWARMSYTVTLSLYYVRFLQVFYVERVIGPKVVMIWQMFEDVLMFIGVLMVFILSYGVAAQNLLYPNHPYTWNIFKKVLMMPYLQMYGEMFLDELQGDVPGCSSNATVYENDPSVPRCPQDSWLVMVLFSIYMMLTSVLLVNLLIAMFSHTFEKVQGESEKVWRFHRHGLIKEYFTRPALAPPLIIFTHIYRLLKVLQRCCIKHSCTNTCCTKLCCQNKEKLKNNDFRRQFDADMTRQLQEFERSGMNEYYKQVEQKEPDNEQSKADLMEALIWELSDLKNQTSDILTMLNKLSNAGLPGISRQSSNS